MVRLLNAPQSSIPMKPSAVMNASAMIQSALLPLVENMQRKAEIEARAKASREPFRLPIRMNVNATGLAQQARDEDRKNQESAFLDEIAGAKTEADRDAVVQRYSERNAESGFGSKLLGVLGLNPKYTGSLPAVDAYNKYRLTQSLASEAAPKYGAMPWYMAPNVDPETRSAMMAKDSHIRPEKEPDPLAEEKTRAGIALTKSKTAKYRAEAGGKGLGAAGKAAGAAWKNSGLGQIVTAFGDTLGLNVDPKERAQIAEINARTEKTKKETGLLGSPKAAAKAKDPIEGNLKTLEQAISYYNDLDGRVSGELEEVESDLGRYRDAEAEKGFWKDAPARVEYQVQFKDIFGNGEDKWVTADESTLARRSELQGKRDHYRNKLARIQSTRGKLADRYDRLAAGLVQDSDPVQANQPGEGHWQADAAHTDPEKSPMPGSTARVKQAASVTNGHGTPSPAAEPPELLKRPEEQPVAENLPMLPLTYVANILGEENFGRIVPNREVLDWVVRNLRNNKRGTLKVLRDKGYIQ